MDDLINVSKQSQRPLSTSLPDGERSPTRQCLWQSHICDTNSLVAKPRKFSPVNTTSQCARCIHLPSSKHISLKSIVMLLPRDILGLHSFSPHFPWFDHPNNISLSITYEDLHAATFSSLPLFPQWTTGLTAERNRGSIAGRGKILFPPLLQSPNRFWGPPSLLYNEYPEDFPGRKVAGA
jgi:hypothetical protein